VVIHNGSSVDPNRQAGSHTHAVVLDPSGNYAFACDLGLDKVYQYVFPGNGSLLQNPSGTSVSPAFAGAGPRHLAFHPAQRFVYLVSEMLSTVDVYQFDNRSGTLVGPLQSISTLPSSFNGSSEAAEVAVTPDGRFLYASNRGYDSIVGFYIDQSSTDFNLKVIGWWTYKVVVPRNFAIDPTGSLLWVGSSLSNEIVAFSIHQTTGALSPTGVVVPSSIPESIQIVTVPENLDSLPNPKQGPNQWSLVTGAVVATMLLSMLFAVFILFTLLRRS